MAVLQYKDREQQWRLSSHPLGACGYIYIQLYFSLKPNQMDHLNVLYDSVCIKEWMAIIFFSLNFNCCPWRQHYWVFFFFNPISETLQHSGLLYPMRSGHTCFHVITPGPPQFTFHLSQRIIHWATTKCFSRGPVGQVTSLSVLDSLLHLGMHIKILLLTYRASHGHATLLCC